MNIFHQCILRISIRVTIRVTISISISLSIAIAIPIAIPITIAIAMSTGLLGVNIHFRVRISIGFDTMNETRLGGDGDDDNNGGNVSRMERVGTVDVYM